MEAASCLPRFLSIESENSIGKSILVAIASPVIALGKGERTAARIREVALDQFSRLGFERVTMAGIAHAAGV